MLHQLQYVDFAIAVNVSHTVSVCNDRKGFVTELKLLLYSVADKYIFVLSLCTLWYSPHPLLWAFVQSICDVKEYKCYFCALKYLKGYASRDR